MMAAMEMCRQAGVVKIVVAAPVSASGAISMIQPIADAVVVLDTTEDFRCVAQAYKSFEPVSEQEVNRLVQQWRSSSFDLINHYQ
jgi:predicted phosphoribosyltransferase